VYTLIFDDNTSILYAGTNKGLFAYKQNHFIKLKDAPNQIGASFFQLLQHADGSIFCCNLNGQIFKVNDLSLEVFSEIDKSQITNIFDIFIANDGYLIAFCNELIRIDAKGKQEIISDYQNAKFGYSYSYPQYSYNGDIRYSLVNDTIQYHMLHDKVGISIEKKANVTLKQNTYTKSISIKGHVFDITPPNIITSIDSTITIALDSFTYIQNTVPYTENSALIYNSTKGGQIITLRNDTLLTTQHLFKNDFISTVTKNKKRTLFLGSFGDGIRVVPKIGVTNIESQELFLGMAVSPDNDIYVSTRSGDIYNNGNFEKPYIKHNTNIDNLFYMAPFDSVEKIISVQSSLAISSIKDLCLVDDSLFLSASNNGLYAVFNTTTHPYLNFLEYQFKRGKTYGLLPKLTRCKTVTYSHIDSLIYYGTNFGLFTRSPFRPEIQSIKYKEKAFLCNDLESKDDLIYCGTQNFGILIYQNGNFKTKITNKDGLLSNTIEKIKIQDSILYILTEKGMQVFDLQNNHFLGLGINEGMTNKEVTNFAVSADRLWLLEKHKYYSIPQTEIFDNNPVGQLYIDSILINDTPINYSDSKSFSHTENKVDFYFDYRDIETKEETTIKYTLDGFYNKWKTIPTSTNKIEFQSLPVGTYTFKLRAIYRDQETEIFEYRFEIRPPYWQQWWFYLLLVFSAALIVFLIARYILTQVKKRNTELLEKETLSKDLAQTKLKALRSQMNPHFIFNSLNSIQDLVLQQDVDKSYDYIVLFADLVRSTLNYSEQEFISIDKELEFLKVYLELEKLRYGEEFSYTINYTGSYDIIVPSLVVQPFIENALLHGLLNKKGSKKLDITFEMDKQMICTVTDNGIGRVKAAKIKERQQKQHASFSTSAIKKRMEILSQQFEMEAKFEYQDLIENGEISGTIAIITMPFKNF